MSVYRLVFRDGLLEEKLLVALLQLTGASDEGDLAGQEITLVRSEGTWLSVHIGDCWEDV